MGLLNMETDAPDDFTPQVFEFTSLLAARSASATENARLYEQSQQTDSANSSGCITN